MAHYGQIIDDTFSPESDEFSKHFVTYFNQPRMHKIKDVGSYSVYMTKTYCLLSKYCRYIIAMVGTDGMPVGNTETLDRLNWVSLQTRLLADKHNLPSHSYNPTRNTPLNVVINREEKTDKYSKYSCKEFPLEVILLNEDNDKQYQDTGSLIAAIETYQTVISKKGV